MSSSTAASNNNDHQSLHSEALLSYSVQSSEHDTQEASNAPLIDTTQQSQRVQPQQHLDTQVMYHMPHSLTLDSFDNQNTSNAPTFYMPATPDSKRMFYEAFAPDSQPSNTSDILIPSTPTGIARPNKRQKRASTSSSSSSMIASSYTPSTPTASASALVQAANSVPDTPISTTFGGASSKKSGSKPCRDDSSLRLLTKRFVQLIAEAEDGVLDLNAAAEKLAVQKRRIYDITNVLEGIGLIEKKSKNNIQWKGAGMAVTPVQDNLDEIRQLHENIANLEVQEKQIDDQIERLKDTIDKMVSNEDYQKHNYVTYRDILSIPTLKDRTVLAIRAPSGTMLTVPDPDEGMEYPNRRYQIHLKSPSQPIKVYLLTNEGAENDIGAETKSPSHLGVQPSSSTSSSYPSTSQHPNAYDSPLRPNVFDSDNMSVTLSPSRQDFVYGMESNEGITDIFS
jgi:hypothetical protein